MSISHANFLTQIRNYTEVSSSVLSDTLIDQFIRNTELDIAGKVDYDDIRKYVLAQTVASQRYLNRPDDELVIRSVQIISSSTRDFLEKRDTSFIAEFNPTDATGQPKYYANWNENVFLLAPVPDQAYDIQLNYIKNPPHFASTGDSTANFAETYLSKFQEHMLLHGVLTECFSYLKGPVDMYNLYKTKYNEEIQDFALQQMGRRRRAEYDDGVPRIQVASPSP
tara:strand:- start:287 stop:958 length:672 start_codon:yes stop_codon:yes gene_type:complete